MSRHHSPRTVNNGCVLYLDAANSKSYPGSGTTCYDLSNIRNNGTLVNGVGYSSDYGGVFVFDGIDDSITMNKSYTTDGTIGVGNVPYSIEAWCYLTITPGNNTEGCSIIGNDGEYGIGLQILNRDDGIKVNFGYRNASNMFSNSTISLNTWYHIVGIGRDGNDNYICINGIRDATFNSSTYIYPTGGATNMRIGLSVDRMTTLFKGYIAMTKLYNIALSASEVLQNFNATKGRFGL
jgi:hypothetical protein